VTNVVQFVLARAPCVLPAGLGGGAICYNFFLVVCRESYYRTIALDPVRMTHHQQQSCVHACGVRGGCPCVCAYARSERLLGIMNMAVWPLNSLIPVEDEENRAISPVVFAG
jgi:hypothetical protein